MVGIVPEPGSRLVDGDYVKGIAQGQNRFVASGITAFAGGGQANATQLAPNVNFHQVDTVASGNDSVKLPFAVPGAELTVYNASGNTLFIFANDAVNKLTGIVDTINAVANATQYSLVTVLTARFSCAKAGQWSAIKSA